MKSIMKTVAGAAVIAGLIGSSAMAAGANAPVASFAPSGDELLV